MEWSAWAPTYDAILADFAYARAHDEIARDTLDALLRDRLLWTPPRIEGEATILGPAASSLSSTPRSPLLVADPRAPPPERPFAIVTDLDGDVALQLALNATGVPLVVHAHGDNVPALVRHVPHMHGPVLGSCQCAPRPAGGRVRNFGGFTDGDRAACLAVALGASSLRLVGFDYDTPVAKPSKDAAVKARKLAWARRIVDALGVPVRVA